MKVSFRILAAILVNVFFTIGVFGQAVNLAQIHGRITDPSGAVVASAQVQARQLDTGLVRATTTNSDGQYSLPALPLGAYELAVSAQGFQKYLQKGITLEVSANPQVDITLKIGNTAETVEVRADAQLVETHENAVSP